jgi:hypothetical protein
VDVPVVVLAVVVADVVVVVDEVVVAPGVVVVAVATVEVELLEHPAVRLTSLPTVLLQAPPISC